MKSFKANVLCLIGIALGVASVGCGDAIQKSQDTYEAIGWMLLACILLVLALVACALGANAENEYIQSKSRKVDRIAYHTNEWRDVQ